MLTSISDSVATHSAARPAFAWPSESRDMRRWPWAGAHTRTRSGPGGLRRGAYSRVTMPPSEPGSRSRPWFVRRRYGVGYRPFAWQGWLIAAALVGVTIIAL